MMKCRSLSAEYYAEEEPPIYPEYIPSPVGLFHRKKVRCGRLLSLK